MRSACVNDTNRHLREQTAPFSPPESSLHRLLSRSALDEVNPFIRPRLSNNKAFLSGCVVRICGLPAAARILSFETVAGVCVIVAYRPKPGKEEALLELVRRRVPTLREEGLV